MRLDCGSLCFWIFDFKVRRCRTPGVGGASDIASDCTVALGEVWAHSVGRTQGVSLFETESRSSWHYFLERPHGSCDNAVVGLAFQVLNSKCLNSKSIRSR